MADQAGSWAVLLTSPQGNGVHVFVTKNGHLHQCRRQASVWTWTDRGSPGGGGAFGDPSALINSNAETFVFVRVADGTLSVLTSANAFNNPNPQWSWTSLSAPGGSPVTGDPTGMAHEDGRVAVFVVGRDKKLYSCRRQGASWTWVAHGRPAGTKLLSEPPALAVTGGHATAWVIGTDGNLHRCQYDAGLGTSTWQNLGRPSGVMLTGAPDVGAYIGVPDPTLIFARGDDHHLYQRVVGTYVDRGLVGTSSLGSPATASLEPMNGFAAKRPIRVFVMEFPVASSASSARLAETSFNGSAWSWKHHHQPAGVFLTHRVSVVAVPKLTLNWDEDQYNPYWVNVFMRGATGNVYLKLCDDYLSPPWQSLKDLGSP